MKLAKILALALIMFGCQSYSEEEIQSFDNEIDEYIEDNQLDMNKLESGLYYRVIEDSKSHSTIKYNDQVTFYYTGSILGGEVFQQIPEEEALTFQVKELIVGWQEGLMQLHGKGSIELIIPPHLGYGAKDTKKIPPNSTLHYTLTVTDVK